MKWIILIFIICYFIKHYFVYPVKIGKSHLSVFFGIPGTGKTTVAAWYAKQYNKKKIKVFSNVPIKNTYQYDVLEDLGKYKIDNALVIVDEASICFNNRNYKSFPQYLIQWFKMHRHEHCEVIVFSQSYEDFDITIRRLTYTMYLLKRSKLPFFIKLIPIKRSIGINEQTQKPDDVYAFYPWFLGWLYNRRVFGPLVWNDFNSWNELDLPRKEFEIYDPEQFEKPKKEKVKIKDKIKIWYSKVKTFKLKDLRRFKR